MVRASGELHLFEDSAKLPDGFIYHPNFAEEEEQELIGEIQQLHLTPFQ